MTLNDVAVQVLGDPPAIRVGYDAEQRQIGLRASLRDEAGAILDTGRPGNYVARRPRLGSDTGSRSMYAGERCCSTTGVLPSENYSFRLDDIGGRRVRAVARRAAAEEPIFAPGRERIAKAGAARASGRSDAAALHRPAPPPRPGGTPNVGRADRASRLPRPAPGLAAEPARAHHSVNSEGDMYSRSSMGRVSAAIIAWEDMTSAVASELSIAWRSRRSSPLINAVSVPR